MGGGKGDMKPSGGLKYIYIRNLLGKKAYISNLGEIEHKVWEKVQFSLFGWGKRGNEASGWTSTYFFVCLISKRAYISNLSLIKRKLTEKLPLFLLG